MRKINFGVLAFLFLFSMFLMTSCNSENSASSIKFKTIEGKISKPINGIEAPYDSISLEYAIAWPVGGNDEMQSYIKSWVINGVTQGSGIRNAKMSIDQILEAIADKMAKDENSPFEKRITVSVEENDPFDSYLSIGLSNEGLFWMAAYQDYYNDNLTIRMTDGEVFQADNAIWNTDGMRSLIAKHLERECKAEDPNWRWSEQIIDYSPYNLPLPTQPISLTKEGILIQYGLAEISARPAGTFSCIIPYDEAMPVLTNEAREFLTASDAPISKKEESKHESAEEKFAKSIPDFKSLFCSIDFEEGDLEKLGFSMTENSNNIEDYDLTVSEKVFLLKDDSSHYCKITYKPGAEAYEVSFTIVGYPDLMEKYKEEAKAFKSSAEFGNFANPWIEIKQNEITFGDGL